MTVYLMVIGYSCAFTHHPDGRTPRLQDLDNKLLDTCSTEGSIKSPLHVCPSYSSAFFSEIGH